MKADSEVSNKSLTQMLDKKDDITSDQRYSNRLGTNLNANY